MNKPKISIIIPVYNVENYLEECLNSIIYQTFREIEIICINDGSKDYSLEILKSYAARDNRIKIIDKENGGYASAINVGINTAKGDFIQIIESDDYCALNMLEEMYKKINSSDADLITSDFYFLKGSKLKICKYLKEEDASVENFNLQSLPYIISRQAYPWKSLYRKSFLTNNDIHMLQDGNGAYEDQPWNATVLSLATKILYINKPFYFYRLDANGSSTNNGSRKMINYITRKAQTMTILKQYGNFCDEVKEYYCDSAVGGCLFFFKRISFDYKEEYYNTMKSFLLSIIDENVSFKHFTKKNKKAFDRIKKLDYKNFNKINLLKNRICNIFK